MKAIVESSMALPPTLLIRLMSSFSLSDSSDFSLCLDGSRCFSLSAVILLSWKWCWSWLSISFIFLSMPGLADGELVDPIGLIGDTAPSALTIPTNLMGLTLDCGLKILGGGASFGGGCVLILGVWWEGGGIEENRSLSESSPIPCWVGLSRPSSPFSRRSYLTSCSSVSVSSGLIASFLRMDFFLGWSEDRDGMRLSPDSPPVKISSYHK